MPVTDRPASVSLADIEAARGLLREVAVLTPVKESRALSEHAGTPVLLKCENLQRTGSFKIRGAYVRLSRLSAQERARGVVAASASNHAQGVALAASLLGIPSTVFMPEGAPIPKEHATTGYGADVRLVGSSIEDALVAAQAFAAETGAVLIHPFDHADIVAGHGTVGLEICEQVPQAATVLVSMGGGGLAAGIATALAAVRPDIQVIGVQAAQVAAYPGSLEAGEPVAVTPSPTLADGIAVARPGAVPFAAVVAHLHSVVTVSEDSLSRALLMLAERAKLVVEPAGAAAVAALLEHRFDGPIVAVLSGGNVDPLLLMQVIRHGLASAGRYLALRVRIPDRPGELVRMLGELAAQQVNVLDVAHERTSAHVHVDEVVVALQVETRGAAHRERVVAALRQAGYQLTVT
ncbi:MAG: threonine ammonia-lyase [Actinomycetota bacterium]|nr:threonine ammonia-lyase [Actinomycetota bacterium]